MKKYISILSLVTAFFMQSCERNDSDLNEMGQESQNLNIPHRRESVSTENDTMEVNGTNNFQGGEDDDPPRDKQHWRTVKDSVR